jgi:hypothetical protein
MDQAIDLSQYDGENTSYFIGDFRHATVVVGTSREAICAREFQKELTIVSDINPQTKEPYHWIFVRPQSVREEAFFLSKKNATPVGDAGNGVLHAGFGTYTLDVIPDMSPTWVNTALLEEPNFGL